MSMMSSEDRVGVGDPEVIVVLVADMLGIFEVFTPCKRGVSNFLFFNGCIWGLRFEREKIERDCFGL